MEHLLLKAATTATTDQGTFEAVISTPTVDRDKDIVEPSAMVNALTKWATLGKLVPLAWAHTDEVVGNVDPSTVKVVDGEVIVKGQVDMTIPRGEETWRLVKSGTLSFSFGYLIPDGGASKLAGGRFHIKELDVFEISVVPVAPANNDTRVVGWKSATDPDLAKELQEVKSRLAEAEKALEDLTKQADETGNEEPCEARSADSLSESAQKLALEIRSGGLSAMPPRTKQVVQEPKPEPEMGPDELRRHSRDLMIQVLSGETT